MLRTSLRSLIKKLLKIFIVLLPWPLRRRMLIRFFGYTIHPTARIGFSWIFPDFLILEEGATIDHFTVAIHLQRISLGRRAWIGRGNWITGFPKNNPKHFSHRLDRSPSLLMGADSAITKNHHIDCTDLIEVGEFATIAGYASQLLTHSINLDENRQDCAPISIGRYCFVGTNVVILGGSRLPDRSVLGAKSLLTKAFVETDFLYAGVPASPIRKNTDQAEYFKRAKGFVN